MDAQTGNTLSPPQNAAIPTNLPYINFRMKDFSQTSSSYPGSDACAAQILELAEAYYDAANALFDTAKKNGPLSYAPARLCSIHAIELFLNAFLRNRGESAESIRARMHNLADEEFVTKLILKKKTAKHLQEMTKRREYLISRYAPERASQHTELNRLTATLEEVRAKTNKYLAQA
ncbi:hypothetical protein [Roseovarius rhodophyticola]|uniref:HEPN domain-containing protein n=1 Tax=Roseovarius rhodophyticola TaxID=3080827 RepID=A0ABZ2TCI5_9RHOB|nr:hypothetical protein [Roseovarius sp. W115]MDV2931148.1 hypothetical protein [Roseovarius sp. W115]